MPCRSALQGRKERTMTEEGLCVGCGCECLDTIECRCGRQEMIACEDCRNSDINLVCGVCRDRAQRVVPLNSYPCRDFQEDQAGVERELGEGLPVNASVGALKRPYRAS